MARNPPPPPLSFALRSASTEANVSGARCEPRLNDVAQQQYESTVRSCGVVLQHVADQVGVTWEREVEEVASLVVMAVDGATLRWLVDKDSQAALRRLGDVARMLVSMAR